MKRVLVLLFLLLVMAFLLAPRSSGTCGLTGKITDAYPLMKGNYWIYQGKVKYMVNGDKVVEESVTLKMEIVDVMKKGHLLFAIVKGYPNDLLVVGQKHLSDNLIIRVGPNRYYLLKDDKMRAALIRINNAKDNMGDLVQGEDQILDVPLMSGKVFGEADSITRQDLFFCWVVNGEKNVNLDGTKGISPSGKMKQFTLVYKCLTSSTAICFVPGIGITGYKYSHHGTIEELEVKLIETNVLNKEK